jgi:hypothetical protein
MLVEDQALRAPVAGIAHPLSWPKGGQRAPILNSPASLDLVQQEPVQLPQVLKRRFRDHGDHLWLEHSANLV